MLTIRREHNNNWKRSIIKRKEVTATADWCWRWMSPSKMNLWNPKFVVKERRGGKKEQLYAEVEFSAQGYDTHFKHSPLVDQC